MTLHWLAVQVWRYRVAGLMGILGVTFLLIIVGTHLLQHSSSNNFHKGRSKMPMQASDPKQRPNILNQGHLKESDTLKDEMDSNLYELKTQPPPVVFLKTHKTGSSTVQNLLFRVGEKGGATFAFPAHTYQFSYPDKFKVDFVDELPEGSSHFDILCSHMRLDVGQLKQLMPPNTVYVTILREPVQMFESVFSYYTFTVPAFTSAKKAAGHRSALSVFLESPESFWDPKERGNGLGKNPMSFDLGLGNQHWSSHGPANLTLLAETFQLVMIAEHFDESLVLLGDLLKLELEELAYVTHNSRSANSLSPLDNVTKARIRVWNQLDVLLYDFFLQVFWQKAEQYGLERLNRDVAELRASTHRIRQKCVAQKQVPPAELDDLIRPWQTDSVTITGYHIHQNLTKQEQGFCMRLVLPELQYHAHLYFLQYGRAVKPLPTE